MSATSRRTPDRQRANAFARLFEAVHEGVYIGTIARVPDASGGSTLAANPHLKIMLGYPPENPDDDVLLFHEDRFVDPPARATFLARLLNEGAVTDYLLRLKRRDGETVWVEVTARADRVARGSAYRVEALVRDVSERKRLDDQSRELYQQLLQAEKMAALGQAISGVAHELNNPLATILSWAERLSEKADEATRRGLEVILGESERAARIVRNLLTFARKRQSTRSLIDLNQVVRETMNLRAYEQRAINIELITALAAGLPPVFADAHQLQQVLLNLVINAEQAMLGTNGRGSLVIRTWHDADRDGVMLQVSDDGPGIPADVRSKIFDPFFTTKDTGKGTGLGLTVAYAIVQEHGGSIRVESSPAGGASFSVELPVGVTETVTKPRQPSSPHGQIAGHASVLLVEDERALALAVSEALVDAGLSVDHAGDGEEALAHVRQKSYDLVICDLKMPKVDGMSVYRAIAAASPSLARRVIFVTGDVAGADAERFLEESGCRWLAKPFRLGDLLRSVREALA